MIAPPTIVIISTLEAVLTNASGISVIESAKIVGKLKNGTRISGGSVFGKEADGYSWTHVTAPDIH